MTGIDRLRELADKYAELGKYHTTIDVVPSGMAMLFSSIANQIEREHAEDCYGMVIDHGTVSRVASEMERHVSGVEGMEDSPVARWARELREALGALHAPGFQKSRKVANSLTSHSDASDVSMSAYDLLPQEERDAIAWVRKHGGIDHVRAEWRSRVPRDLYQRRRWRLLGHIAECETALGRRRERIEELEGRVKALTNENAELRRRAMPEGCEWPRYEDEEPVRIGDVVSDVEVRSVVFRDGGILLSDCTSVPGWGTWRSYKEPIKRPSVPAADGEPLEVGQTVWDECGDELRVLSIEDDHERHVACHYEGVDGIEANGWWLPRELTHTKPEPPKRFCRDCAHWQKDPIADNMGVCWFFYHEYEGQDCYSARLSDVGACEEFMPSARALAERERGE